MGDGTPILVPIVAGVILKQSGKYLLVQEQKPDVRGLWNWPAGKVDEGYTIEQTAVKEAKEECGFDVQLIREIGIWQKTEKEPAKHAFVAEIISGTLQYPKEEIMDAKWFTLEEMRGMKDQLRNDWVLEAAEMMEKKP